MSRETSEWLNRNVLVGFTDKRGNAWHYKADDQGDEPNHYPGPVPVADVGRVGPRWLPRARGGVRTMNADTPHLFDPDTHNEALPDLWAEPVAFGPSTIVADPTYRCPWCWAPMTCQGWFGEGERFRRYRCDAPNCEEHGTSWPETSVQRRQWRELTDLRHALVLAADEVDERTATRYARLEARLAAVHQRMPNPLLRS